MDPEDYIVNVVMSFYVDEPCRICGELIKPEDLSDLVWAWYSKDNNSHTAHGNCWEQNKPKSEWAYPVDAIE